MEKLKQLLSSVSEKCADLWFNHSKLSLTTIYIYVGIFIPIQSYLFYKKKYIINKKFNRLLVEFTSNYAILSGLLYFNWLYRHKQNNKEEYEHALSRVQEAKNHINHMPPYRELTSELQYELRHQYGVSIRRQRRDTYIPKQIIQHIPKDILHLCIDTTDISSLSDMPRALLELSLWFSKVDSLQGCPPNLQSLSIEGNKITNLTGLPINLKYLCIDNNNLTKIVELPKTLETILCAYNKIHTIDLTGTQTNHLSCYGNPIKKLIIPNSVPLKILLIGDTDIHFDIFLDLPDSIEHLHIIGFYDKPILIDLPKSLESLTFYGPLTTIETYSVPSNLQTIHHWTKLPDGEFIENSTSIDIFKKHVEMLCKSRQQEQKRRTYLFKEEMMIKLWNLKENPRMIWYWEEETRLLFD